MPFQKQVAKEPAAGLPGGWSSANMHYAAPALAGEDITVGRMCRIVAGSGTGEAMNPDRAYMGGSGAIGIAMRSRVGVITDLTDEYSDTINKNLSVELAVTGDFNVYLTGGNLSAVSKGMKVFYREENTAAAGEPSNAGELMAGEAGSAESGFVESDWYVYKVMDTGTGLTKVSTYRKA